MLEALIAAAEEAGRAILSVYRKDPETVRKEDGSPLTVADRLAHGILSRSLAKIAPDLPVFSEEGKSVEYDVRKGWKQYFLVDPLDGTKGFIEQNGEFTVNIAVIRGGRPVLGVVHHPDGGATYAAETGSGAFRVDATGRTALKGVDPARTGLRILTSRNDASTVLVEKVARLGPADITRMHSAVKFCLLAEGSSDVYLRMQPSMEWDAAAGHLVLEESGGRLLQFNGEPLLYNRVNLLNPPILAFSRSFPEKLPHWKNLLLDL